MRIQDLPHGDKSTLELQPALDEDFGDAAPRGGIEVFFELAADGEPVLTVGDERWAVTGVRAKDREQLQRIVEGGSSRLCWVIQAHPKNKPSTITVQVHLFPGAFQWEEEQKIGIKDRALEQIRERRKSLVSIDEARTWLTKKMLLPAREPGGPVRLLLSGTPDRRPGTRTAFRILGQGFAVDVAPDKDDKLQVTRVVTASKPRRGEDRNPLHLTSGWISFSDSTEASLFRGTAQTELDVMVDRQDSYLKLWNTYNDLELKAILRRARQLGGLEYTRVLDDEDGSGYRFTLTVAAGENLRAHAGETTDLELQASEQIPAAILEQRVSLDDDRGSQDKPYMGRVSGFLASPPTLFISSLQDMEDRRPPEKGFLHISLSGDKMRLRRRREAWLEIKGATCPMPQLGFIIEKRHTNLRHRVHINALSPAAIEAFPGPPTSRQRAALSRALNTPDICLIQGPPGTGKTRVVAALMARLSDPDLAEDLGLSGSGLLTSYQHDAVETVASATKVMGMPAVKVGRRRDGQDDGEDSLETWRTETLERARYARAARQQEGKPSPLYGVLQKVRSLTVGYLKSPSRRDDPQAILAQAVGLAHPWLPARLNQQAADLRARLRRGPSDVQHGDADERDFALRAVRALRYEPLPFSDDGPRSAHRVLSRLSRLEGFTLGEREMEILQQAARLAPEEQPPADLLDSLAQVRDQFLDQLTPASLPGTAPRAHAEVSDLLSAMVDALRQRDATTRRGVEVAQQIWISDLEGDLDGIRRTAQHYTRVLASTCQQSVSRAMSLAKGGTGTVFQNVIVDEAARANPLDLFIPMAQADRRIILVGDHRQLPHILEPEVERELERSVNKETHQALRKSLFWRLFKELRQREKQDGVRRTVTLDVQYRMHPVLGEFISQVFYEEHGESFRSGLPAEHFEHDVELSDGTSLKGKVAAWIDVPLKRGREKGGRTKRRPAEARRLAQEARTIVTNNPMLSVGVITFYQGQRQAILEAMEQEGLSDRDEKDQLRVCHQFRRTPDHKRERLRVGTADAFQGKEFDVVLLSLTRASKVPEARGESASSLRGRYGFLMLENRMCVAMSRQHRLLILVGDLQMATGNVADKGVPHLTAFRELCEGDHGAIV